MNLLPEALLFFAIFDLYLFIKVWKQEEEE